MSVFSCYLGLYFVDCLIPFLKGSNVKKLLYSQNESEKHCQSLDIYIYILGQICYKENINIEKNNPISCVNQFAKYF